MQIAQESENFHMEKAMLKHNIRKISLVSKITSVILIFLVFSQILLALFTEQSLKKIVTVNSLPFILIIGYNVICLFITDGMKLRLNKDQVTNIDRFISLYIAGLFAFGVVISLLESALYNHLMIYTLVTFICSSFFVLRKWQLFIPLFTAGIALCCGLFIQGGFTGMLQAQILYIITVMAVSHLLSRSFYRSFTRSARVESDLLREIEFGRKISRELREANRKLGLQATHDPLTKLYNRRAFNEYIDNLQMRSESGKFEMTAVMLDIDCFKLYNDHYGHSQGDLVLKEIASVLKEIAEQYGVFAARWGGEEFSLILIDESEKKVRMICEEIIHAVHMLKIEHKKSLVDRVVTVSIGAHSEHIEYSHEILQCIVDADAALYEVKNNGRNAYLLRRAV